MAIQLAGGNKHGLFICEIQPNSVAYKAGLLVADKIFSVSLIRFYILTIARLPCQSVLLVAIYNSLLIWCNIWLHSFIQICKV